MVIVLPGDPSGEAADLIYWNVHLKSFRPVDVPLSIWKISKRGLICSLCKSSHYCMMFLGLFPLRLGEIPQAGRRFS